MAMDSAEDSIVDFDNDSDDYYDSDEVEEAVNSNRTVVTDSDKNDHSINSDTMTGPMTRIAV